MRRLILQRKVCISDAETSRLGLAVCNKRLDDVTPFGATSCRGCFLTAQFAVADDSADLMM